MMNSNSNYDGNNVFFYSIEVLDKNRNVIEFLQWRDLPAKIYFKFSWYFKYRQALLQVKYPKNIILNYRGIDKNISVKLKEIIIKNKMISRKRKITEMNNKLNFIIKNWCELFPYNEDIIYLKILNRKNKLENELKNFELEYNEIKNAPN